MADVVAPPGFIEAPAWRTKVEPAPGSIIGSGAVKHREGEIIKVGLQLIC